MDEDLALVRNPQSAWDHIHRKEGCLPPHMWGIAGIPPCALHYVLYSRAVSCGLRLTPLGYAKPYACGSMSDTGDGPQQRVRCSMSLRYFMLVLGLLVIADAHIATAFAGDQAIVEPTCGASLPTLQRDATPSIHSLELMPSTLSQIASTLLHVQALSPSTFEQSLLPNGNWHQDQLQDFVHVFLF